MPPRKKKTSTDKPAAKGGHQAASTPEKIVAPPKPSDAAQSADPRPKKPTPTYGSLCRRKRTLVDQIKEGVDPARANEIRAELDGPLADIPVLSREELDRLTD